MLGLLNRKDKDPRHLAHFVNHWIDRNQLDQADRWLAELKKADPRGLQALELEARLLDVRKRRPSSWRCSRPAAAKSPTRSASSPTSSVVTGSPRRPRRPTRRSSPATPSNPNVSSPWPSSWPARTGVPEAMEILRKAWTTCRPEQVAAAALHALRRPVGGRGREAPGGSLAGRGRPPKRPDSVELQIQARGSSGCGRAVTTRPPQLFRRLVAESPDDVQALNSLAWLLALRDPAKSQEALRLINHAIDVDGGRPVPDRYRGPSS